MFHASDLMILNKTDLLPYLDFDVERRIEYARRVNPGIRVLQLSAKSGEGIQGWYQWIRAARQLVLTDHPSWGLPGYVPSPSGAWWYPSIRLGIWRWSNSTVSARRYPWRLWMMSKRTTSY